VRAAALAAALAAAALLPGKPLGIGVVLVAEVGALWLGGLFALLVAAGVIQKIRRRLARIALAGTAAALLAFSLADPDRLIAEHNVARWRDTGLLDLAYLQGLSADAAPAVAGLPPGLRRQALAPLRSRLGRNEPWSSFNLARERARDVIAAGL
jgi:hypothetical protein